MNAGTILLGLLNGLTIGLLAVGFVLVYKANKFLNLAHAQLGALSALILAKLVLDEGWNFWLAFVFAVSLGVVTGVAVERFLVGPLRARTSSPITLLLLSLGIGQLLLALVYVPALGPDQEEARQYPQPFASDLTLSDVSLSGMSMLTMVLVPLLGIALAVFIKYSLLGKQIRAAANNPDAARLSGISVDLVSAVTWGVAGGLSAVSAILQAPTQPSFNVAALGPYLLLLTLGAAAFGAFVSMPMALLGGLVIGLVAQSVASITSSGSDAQLAVFVLVLGIVLVRGKAIGQVFALSGAVVQERPVLRVPEVLRGSVAVRFPGLLLGGAALLVAAVLPQLPYFDSVGNRFSLALIAVYALLGVALTMLVGWGGQVSLGHFAVVGVSSYLTVQWAPNGWSIPALLLFTGVVGAVLMVLVGLPALRVRGLTLAVTTLGFAVVTSEWLLRQSFLGGDSAAGVSLATLPRLGAGLGTPDSPVDYYYVGLAVLTLAVIAAGALRRSMPGRLVVAVRDNERASAAFGVSAATVKLSILAVSGFYAGMAGVLFVGIWTSVAPGQFTADVSLALIAVPVIGGLGSLAGAVGAAALLYGGTFFLGPLAAPLFGDFGSNLGFALFLAGAGQTYALLKLPSGLAGAVQSRWQVSLDRRAARLVQAQAQGADALPLTVEGVQIDFGGVRALDQPDIHVRPGEIVGLIGTNGAGKTTLMNVISGVIPPQSGSVRVFGQEVLDLAPDFRAAYGLSRSFQDASLFAGLTVTDTVQLAIARRHKVGLLSAMLGAPWARASERRTREQAREIVERFGLVPWADARTADLSTGTKRICDLAAQVASRPKVLLLDEPTAGVAQREAEAFGPLLRRIRDELDCAILIVEHDMPLLMGLCDRMYALETGRVIAEGTPEEMRNDPRVVASYLGTDSTAVDRSGSTASQQPADETVVQETEPPRARPRPAAPRGRTPALVGAGPGDDVPATTARARTPRSGTARTGTPRTSTPRTNASRPSTPPAGIDRPSTPDSEGAAPRRRPTRRSS